MTRKNSIIIVLTFVTLLTAVLQLIEINQLWSWMMAIILATLDLVILYNFFQKFQQERIFKKILNTPTAQNALIALIQPSENQTILTRQEAESIVLSLCLILPLADAEALLKGIGSENRESIEKCLTLINSQKYHHVPD